MRIERQVRLFIHGAVTAAGCSLLLTFFFFPPSPDDRWPIAFGTLLLLSLLSTAMALKISETGATTSLDFVPQLGAVLLVGPSGAAAIAAISELISEFLFYRKPTHKKLFNTAQMILSASAAGVVFVWFGGVPSLDTLNYRASFPPFLLAVLAYFTVNTTAVSFIVSLTENQPFRETWRQMAGGLILFDLAMSLLAFLVAFLYVAFNPFALLLTIVPLIGLRYSYGVNYELKQLNADLLRLMVKTIEAQDPYTSGHSIRVANTAGLLVRALRLGPKESRIIETAALLHDIGKIDVAYGEILRQKGPLTPEQRELIRAHPLRGVDIIRSIRSIHPEVLRCVRHHHERWDGEGYPDGLAGEDIPLGARIIMISDTIDAMTTARPYRDPLPIDVVQQELERHSGTQFDPDLVQKVVAAEILKQVEIPRHRARNHEKPSSEVRAASGAPGR